MRPINPHHRQCFLTYGDPESSYSAFLSLCQAFNHLLVVAHDVHHYAPLVSNKRVTLRPMNKIHNELGQSYDAVLLDISDGISASALAILSGTVRGGGAFVIALPKEQAIWFSQPDQQMARYLPWPFEITEVPSVFKRYFLSSLENHSPFVELEEGLVLPALETTTNQIELTDDQQAAQALLLKQEPKQESKTHVLIAPRGRGKSTLLGDTLAHWHKQGLTLAITAANPDALVSAKAQFEKAFAESSLPKFPFYAPDALLLNDVYWDHLIVDEAARLPLPVLEGLLGKAKHCVFSTTDYGYEGAGKGFGIRFCQSLEEHHRPLQRLNLDQPTRWGENDPLENWLNQLFFLTPPLEGGFSVKNHSIEKKHCSLKGVQWLAEPELLKQAFHLLVNAHYQTSPDNLRWILDDPSVETWLSLDQDQSLHSVAIVTEEGKLPDHLSQEVMAGTRRPRGHLLPQSLLAHAGIEEAGRFQYWRISRIATQPSLQSQGFASQLINKIYDHAVDKVDFLSTSFAATSDVVPFWQKNGFIPVRLGTTKDKASGCYSLMMVKPLNSTAEMKAKRWQSLFYEDWLYNLLLQYRDMDTALVITILSLAGASDTFSILQLSAQDKHNLTLFSQAHRPFDTVRASLFKRFVALAIDGKLSPKKPLDCLMLDAILGKENINTKDEHLGRKALNNAIKATIFTNG